jgi:hypothetical protein
MTTPAHVTSIDAIGVFRANLVVFQATATRTLDEVFSEVKRTRQWILNDRRYFWEGELRRRQKALDAALQELMGARLNDLKITSAPQQAAVTKARRNLREAEDKLRRVKYWGRNFDLTADPLAKRLGGLRSLLDHEMPKALAMLANSQRALDNYSEKMGARDPEGGQPENPAPEEPAA